MVACRPPIGCRTYNRGLAYYGLKQYERAIADCDRVLELDPKYVDAYFNRGLAYTVLKHY
jgi:tetratricopeptide (TPR) repeat protein